MVALGGGWKPARERAADESDQLTQALLLGAGSQTGLERLGVVESVAAFWAKTLIGSNRLSGERREGAHAGRAVDDRAENYSCAERSCSASRSCAGS